MMTSFLNAKLAPLQNWQKEELDRERREHEMMREIAEEEIDLNKRRKRISRLAMKHRSPEKYYTLYHVCVD